MLVFHPKANICNGNNEAVGNCDEIIINSTTLTAFIRTENP